ncbi:MAG TPA: VCBS repeat-containing protein [Phycisphaerae bacterium]|nr:VCBS repeat-containing protein [Phycisphaerae bacterium]HNU45887.1 VCBS repeat-containing protein [Phycisphaerae bacterium]
MRTASWLCLLGIVVVFSGCHRPQPGPVVTGPGPQAPGDTTAPPPPVVAPPPPPAAYTLCAKGLPTTGMWKCDPVFVDANLDGHVDLAAMARLGDGPHLWLGDGTGTWEKWDAALASRFPSCGGGLSFVDVNHDGHLDFAVADHCRGVFVYLGDGQGHWEAVTAGLCPPGVDPEDPMGQMHLGAEDLATGDVNGDGCIDIVACASDEGGINVYLGDGSGRNWTHTPGALPATGWANRVLLADMNGDGALDVVSSYADGPRVWHNDGHGKWTPAAFGLPSPSLRGIYTGIDVADVNHDGRPDIAVANWVDGPEVYFQQADQAWTKADDVFPELIGGAVGLALGDLDGDGNVDIVVSGRMTLDPGHVRGVFALFGDGQGHWKFAPNTGLPTTGLAFTAGVSVGDIDGDGVLDIAAGSGLKVEDTGLPEDKAVIEQRLIVWRGVHNR